MVRGPRLPISPDGQVPQRIREAELWLGAHLGHPAWLQTDDGEQSCWTPWGKTRRDIGRGRLRPIRRHAAVSGQGAGRRRTAVAAGAPQCAAGRRGVRSRRVPRHSGVVSGAQLSRLQPKPELLVARGQFKALAGFRSGARSVELLRALRVSDLDRSSACCMTSPKPTVCAHCSPPGSPRRSRTSMCWCPR